MIASALTSKDFSLELGFFQSVEDFFQGILFLSKALKRVILSGKPVSVFFDSYMRFSNNWLCFIPTKLHFNL